MALLTAAVLGFAGKKIIDKLSDADIEAKEIEKEKEIEQNKHELKVRKKLTSCPLCGAPLPRFDQNVEIMVNDDGEDTGMRECLYCDSVVSIYGGTE